MAAEIGEFSTTPSLREQINASIPVKQYVEKYRIRTPEVAEALKDFPVLSYLLGSVSQAEQGRDARPDGVDRPYRLVTEGSGMFGLKNPEDAMRWKGIFNHIVGAAGNVQYLAEQIAQASPEQKRKLSALGYDREAISALDPELLRDMKLLDHAGRRRSDEYAWHHVRDQVHKESDPVVSTLQVLEENDADMYFLDLIKEEEHEYLAKRSENGRISDIRYSVLTYGDWTFGQGYAALSDRFAALRKSRRNDIPVLDALESMGRTFESDMTSVFGASFVTNLANRSPYPWERTLRRAYAAGAGLSADEVFPVKQ